jgi:hypothetical protein
MASAFETDFLVGGWEMLSAVHGKSVTYTASGQAGVAVTAVVDFQASTQQPEGDSRVELRRANVRVSSAVATSPTDRDKFTIDGDDFVATEWRRVGPLVQFTVQALVSLS